MSKPDYSYWLTKQQAAEAIGVSTKTIEKLASEKQIHQGYWRRPQTGAKLAVYHPDDVDRIRRERNPGIKPMLMPADAVIPENVGERITAEEAAQRAGTQQVAKLPQAENFLAALAAVLTPALRAGSETSQMRTDRLFLSIPEAVDYSGLPELHLRRLLKDGRLEGLRTGSGWRIRRSDLEKL